MNSRELGGDLWTHVPQGPDLAAHPVKLVYPVLGTLDDLGQAEVFVFLCGAGGMVATGTAQKRQQGRGWRRIGIAFFMRRAQSTMQ